MLLLEIVVGFIIVSGLVTLWVKYENNFHNKLEAGVLPGQSVESEEPKGLISITVTFIDGSVETYQNDDEVEVSEGGVITLRMKDDHCITFSPYAYRKIEEIHI